MVESEKIPYTIYTIKIEEIYKGDYASESVNIKVPGGESDSTVYVLDGNELSENTEYLFLTKTYDNSYPSLLNMTQAYFAMNEPTAIDEGRDNGISLSEVLEVLEKE